jgi:beta-xylosidase
VAAEGGTFEHHQISIARSKNIWGPYETSKTNPILPPAPSTSYIQQTGLPDFFQDSDGGWWAILLGTRHLKNGSFPIGRETYLTRVSWPTEDDWPVISPVQPEIHISKFKNAPADTKPPPSLPIEKIFLEIRNGPVKPYKSSDNGRTLTLVASQADLSVSVDAPSFVGLRQRKLTGTADVSLTRRERQGPASPSWLESVQGRESLLRCPLPIPDLLNRLPLPEQCREA